MPWQVPPNENNSVLAKGCTQLGIDWHLIPRNVAGCWNLGYCGTGCPTNAKQSMLVSTIPAALDNQSQLIYSARAERLRDTLTAERVAQGARLAERVRLVHVSDRPSPKRIC